MMRADLFLDSLLSLSPEARGEWIAETRAGRVIFCPRDRTVRILPSCRVPMLRQLREVMPTFAINHLKGARISQRLSSFFTGTAHRLRVKCRVRALR